MLNWANTVCRHSTHISSLFFAGAEGGTVTVPVETRIVLGVALRPSHGIAGSQQSISTADVLSQLSFLPALSAFQTFQSSAFPPATKARRITLKWNGPWLLRSLNSPAVSWGPPCAGGQSQAEGGLNPQRVGSECNCTKLCRLLASHLGTCPTWL